MNEEYRILVVDDEQLYAKAIGRELERQGMKCDLAFSGADALRMAAQCRYDAILLDHKLPDMDGILLIPRLLSIQEGAPLFMMTAYQTIPNAVLAIRHGAEDYIVKEASIKPIVDRMLDVRNYRETVKKAGIGRDHQKEGIIGCSPAIVSVVKQLEKIARSPDTTVLFTGETGVGKEVACRYLHRISRSIKSPFVAVDCLSLPENLVESILFGHEKGAFTGADQARSGAFEEAGDGTLFLDEIGDMPFVVQGKLLRVLESRTLRAVGSSREIQLRARVTAATNKDLQSMAAAGKFRQDLFQRISVIPIHIPPLRERGNDILILADHFRLYYSERLGREIAPFNDEVSRRLLDYNYPGNVRELRNIIERASVITETGRIELRHLPQKVFYDESKVTGNQSNNGFLTGGESLGSLEKRMIKDALDRAHGNQSEAARILGISRFQLARKLAKFGINPHNP